jgi:hypothetical protein
MRELLLFLLEHSVQVGLCAGGLGLSLFVVSLLALRARWLLPFGFSVLAASTVATLPAMFVHSRAVTVYNSGGGDFSGIGFLLVPIVFYVIWLPALPVFFLIAISSPTLRRLGYDGPQDDTRNA